MASKVFLVVLCVFLVSIAMLEATPVQAQMLKPAVHGDETPVSGSGAVKMVKQRQGRQFGMGNGFAQASAQASATGTGFGGGFPYGGYGYGK